MKKIFRIAGYDFKRLSLNPITLVVFVVLLVACILLGSFIKIPTTPAYTASISGGTSTQIYQNFQSTKPNLDTKTKLDNMLSEAEYYITIQTSCFDVDDLNSINNAFQTVYNELQNYKYHGHCVYTQNNTINPITNNVYFLLDFINYIKGLSAFETNLIFEKENFQQLEAIAKDFQNQVLKAVSIADHLDYFVQNINKLEQIDQITETVSILKIDPELLSNLQTAYLDKAIAKKDLISKELERISKASMDEEEKIEALTSLITNYKLTCESTKKAIENELNLAVKRMYKNLDKYYSYAEFSQEEIKLEIVKTKHFLADEELYYTQYQQALNFNTASYEVSMFDYAYFIMSIIGLIIILFAMFCGYKLFGRDRKTGKMDTLLSQNVTTGQVFVGKFLAIVFTTSFFLLVFACLSLLWGKLVCPVLPNSIFAVFNLTTPYTISPIWFFLIKIIGIELQAIFYTIITIFIMNLSRKFEINFAIAIVVFIVATVCNIFLNEFLVYCLFPFIHADLTSFLGGATMQTGFLKTSLYAYGNFFISLAYYLVFIILLFNFTKQLFKKN